MGNAFCSDLIGYITKESLALIKEIENLPDNKQDSEDNNQTNNYVHDEIDKLLSYLKSALYSLTSSFNNQRTISPSKERIYRPLHIIESESYIIANRHFGNRSGNSSTIDTFSRDNLAFTD